MKEAVSKFTSIRNIGIKSILSIIGLLVVFVVFYPFIISRLYLTDRPDPVWTYTDWILISMGFFLSVGGAYYNKLADGIASKFNFKTNGKNV